MLGLTPTASGTELLARPSPLPVVSWRGEKCLPGKWLISWQTQRDTVFHGRISHLGPQQRSRAVTPGLPAGVAARFYCSRITLFFQAKDCLSFSGGNDKSALNKGLNNRRLSKGSAHGSCKTAPTPPAAGRRRERPTPRERSSLGRNQTRQRQQRLFSSRRKALKSGRRSPAKSLWQAAAG